MELGVKPYMPSRRSVKLLRVYGTLPMYHQVSGAPIQSSRQPSRGMEQAALAEYGRQYGAPPVLLGGLAAFVNPLAQNLEICQFGRKSAARIVLE